MTYDELKALLPDWQTGPHLPITPTEKIMHVRCEGEPALLVFVSPHKRLIGWDAHGRPLREAQRGLVYLEVRGGRSGVVNVDPETLQTDRKGFTKDCFGRSMGCNLLGLEILGSTGGWDDDPFDMERTWVTACVS